VEKLELADSNDGRMVNLIKLMKILIRIITNEYFEM